MAEDRTPRTDGQPGPGWWLASDGLWYPPKLSARPTAIDGGSATDLTTPNRRGPLLLLGAALIIAGSIGPWATVSIFTRSVSVQGTQGDGKITLVLGIVLLGATVGWWTRLNGVPVLVAFVTAGGAGSLAIYDAINIHSRAAAMASETTLASASVGWGLYVLIAGAVMALVGAAVGRGAS